MATVGTHNAAALASVYNHYLTTYAPKSSSRYDAHKKSELRGVYNSIVKLNKESPLFLSIETDAARKFAVGVKENARELRNTIASLGGVDEGELLNKKAAYSSNDGILSAEYIGDDPQADASFRIEVESLASGQTNLGKFLPDEEVALPADTYSFDVNINDLSYEFQFNVNEGETNGDIQNRLSRLINNANIGLKADMMTNDEGATSLRLSSNATGLPDDRELLFTVTDTNTSRASGAVEYLGIDFTSRIPGNASFTVDGEEFHSYTNEFTVGGQFRVHLKGANPDETVTVGLKTDVDSLTQNISQLIGGYNSFIKAAAEFNGTATNGTKLAGEMSRIAKTYRNDLSNLGLDIERDGTISVNEGALRQSALETDAETRFDSVRNFTNSLLQKANQVSLDPMQYVDKTIVAYKNPHATNNFANPYMTSAYSGMLFNSYC